MPIASREALIPRLRATFPDLPMRVEDEGEVLVVFPARHPDVGDAVIELHEDELRVFIGTLTHAHFENEERGLDAETKAESIATDAVDYLRKVCADEIEFYGNSRAGGARERGDKKRGFLSRYFLGKRTYVWSGPVDEGKP